VRGASLFFVWKNSDGRREPHRCDSSSSPPVRDDKSVLHGLSTTVRPDAIPENPTRLRILRPTITNGLIMSEAFVDVCTFVAEARGHGYERRCDLTRLLVTTTMYTNVIVELINVMCHAITVMKFLRRVNRSQVGKVTTVMWNA